MQGWSIVSVDGVLLEPPYILDFLDPVLLTGLTITHIPARTHWIAAYHEKTALKVLQQPVRNTRRDDNDITLFDVGFNLLWVLFASEAQLRTPRCDTENFVCCTVKV